MTKTPTAALKSRVQFVPTECHGRK